MSEANLVKLTQTFSSIPSLIFTGVKMRNVASIFVASSRLFEAFWSRHEARRHKHRIGFCHTGPVSLCIDLFAFICVFDGVFCFTAYVLYYFEHYEMDLMGLKSNH